MIAILTGDIVNSREDPTNHWLPKLKEILKYYGRSSKQWEIFRGDSFQLLTKPEHALMTAFHIKAAIKQTKNQDVRIAIGIGSETYTAKTITESNGSAYIRSGECFESLKKNTLAIKTNNPDWDYPINLMISLALLTANNWSSTVAEVIAISLENPNHSQVDIAKLLHKSQSSINEALKRGGYDEITNLIDYYKKQISNL